MYIDDEKSNKNKIIIIVAAIIFIVLGYFVYTNFIANIGTRKIEEEDTNKIDLTGYIEVVSKDEDLMKDFLINQKNISSKEYELDTIKLMIKFYQAEVDVYDENIEYNGRVLIDIDNNGRTITRGFVIENATSKDYFTIDMAESFIKNNLGVFKDYNEKKYLKINSNNKISIINPDDGRVLLYLKYNSLENNISEIVTKYNIDYSKYKESLNNEDVFSYAFVKDKKLIFREIRIKDTKVLVKDTNIKDIDESDVLNITTSFE